MPKRTLSVTQLNEYIKGVFEDELILHNISVEGEVFEYKQTPSATFVTLCEKDSRLNCVSFECNQKLAVGEMVSLFGSIAFYGKSGRISFVYKSAQKTGAGTVNTEFNELKEKLAAEGLFDNKKQIVAPVINVGIVTSETGAVIHDFIKTLYSQRRFTNIHVFSSLVQGRFAASDIAGKLKEADGNNCDVIVIARGGGSSDDLSVFNSEIVVRAVAACSTPTISAVGHETDFTLCDFASSLRAGTPSIAGEYISGINEEFFARLNRAAEELKKNILGAAERNTLRLHRAATALSYKSRLKLERVHGTVLRLADGIRKSAESHYTLKKQQLCGYAEKLACNTADTYEQRSLNLKTATASLESNNPLRILSMGYSRLYKQNGEIADCANVEVGESIQAVVADGKFTATVTDKKSHGGANGA